MSTSKVENAISFFEQEFNEKKGILKSLPKGTIVEDVKRLNDLTFYYQAALFALKSMYDADHDRPIPWSNLKNYKALPVYIKEKQVYSDEWFGWWDIVDSVFPERFTTAYSEEFLKKNKGITWEVYFRKIC